MNQLWLLAGPNGSGKTTLLNSVPEFNKFTPFNIDGITQKIDSRYSFAAYKQAYKQFDRNLEESISNSVDIIRETTLCGRGIFRFIENAKRRGYIVSLVFIYVGDVDVCLDRVRHRVSLGGHDVKADDVRRRYINSINNVANHIDEFDYVVFYDNTINM